MTVSTTFADTLRDLTTRAADPLPLPDRLARACVAALPIDGAGVSYALTPDRRWPVGASDGRSAEAERLQFATGEGPCFTAQRRGKAVIAPLSALRAGWPVYTARLTAVTPFRTVVAFPVSGPLTGAAVVDLYCRHPDIVAPEALHDIPVIADLVGTALAADLATASDRLLGMPGTLLTPSVIGRRRVWLAVTRISAEQAVSTSTALALLRAHAFHHDIDLETAVDLMADGQLPLHEDGTP